MVKTTYALRPWSISSFNPHFPLVIKVRCLSSQWVHSELSRSHWTIGMPLKKGTTTKKGGEVVELTWKEFASLIHRISHSSSGPCEEDVSSFEKTDRNICKRAIKGGEIKRQSLSLRPVTDTLISCAFIDEGIRRRSSALFLAITSSQGYEKTEWSKRL